MRLCNYLASAFPKLPLGLSKASQGNLMYVRFIMNDNLVLDSLPQAVLKKLPLKPLLHSVLNGTLALGRHRFRFQHAHQTGPLAGLVGYGENRATMGEKLGQHVRAVLPYRFGYHKWGIGRDALEDIHAHALAVDEAMLQSWIIRVRPAELDPLIKESVRQHSFEPCLRSPATLVGVLAQIAIGIKKSLVVFDGRWTQYLGAKSTLMMAYPCNTTLEEEDLTI